MSVGDVLDGSFKLLKANARTILIIVATIVIPVQLISAFAVRDQVSIGFLNLLNDPTLAGDDSRVDFGNAGVAIITGLLTLLTGPFIAGAVSRVVAASYVGEVMGPAAALKITARRFGALLAASILVFLVEAVGIALCIVPGLLAFALYTAVTPAVMIEEIGPIQAMRRSFRLLRPRMWAVLGIAVLARIIAGILGNLLGGVPPASPPRSSAVRSPGSSWPSAASSRRSSALPSWPSWRRFSTSTAASGTRASTCR